MGREGIARMAETVKITTENRISVVDVPFLVEAEVMDQVKNTL